MRATSLATALALCASLLASAAPADAPYELGETVEITGTVTDPDGEPLADVGVVLRTERRGWSFRELSRVSRDVAYQGVVTDEAGEYAIDWRWDPYYNRFELLVGYGVRRHGREELEVLERVDLGDRIRQGSPVVVPVTVDDVAALEASRAFRASIDTPDEERVYAENGWPDEVRRGHYGGREEASWWYFHEGRVYRFRDGRLVGSDDFEPVRPHREP